MPRCVPTNVVLELKDHHNPDIAAVASELIRARGKLAEGRELLDHEQRIVDQISESVEHDYIVGRVEAQALLAIIKRLTGAVER